MTREERNARTIGMFISRVMKMDNEADASGEEK